jgi:hypothetical protein
LPTHTAIGGDYCTYIATSQAVQDPGLKKEVFNWWFHAVQDPDLKKEAFANDQRHIITIANCKLKIETKITNYKRRFETATSSTGKCIQKTIEQLFLFNIHIRIYAKHTHPNMHMCKLHSHSQQCNNEQCTPSIKTKKDTVSIRF